MNNDEQMEILRKAGYFHDGEDAYSLLAYIDSLKIELEDLRERNDGLSSGPDEDEDEPFDCEDLTGQDREAGWDD